MILIEKCLKATSGNSRVPWKLYNINPIKTKPKMREVHVAETKNKLSETFRPAIPKDLSHPEPKKSAYTEPAKSAFPVKNELVSEPKKSPFSVSEAKVPENEPKIEQKVPSKNEKKVIVPPPPPAGFKSKEVKKSEIVASISSPPPPNNNFSPVEENTQPFKPADNQVFKPAEIINPEPRKELVKQDLQKSINKIEEQKVPPPVVHKSIPPPKIPTIVPLRPTLKANTSVNEGIDLSGIPQNLMPMALVWENAIKDPLITSNPRILKDVEVKMQEFFNKLKNQGFNEQTLKLVIDLTTAFAAGDGNTVNKTHLELTNKTWTENGNWLTAMKRIFQPKLAARGK